MSSSPKLKAAGKIKDERQRMKEIMVYTAESSPIAEMLVERLINLKIPARIGTESASAGAFGTPRAGRTIWVPEKFAKAAKEILTVR